MIYHSHSSGSHIHWYSNASYGHCHIHCWCGDVGQSQEGTAPLLSAPPPGTDHYEMVDEGVSSQFYKVDKKDTQTDGGGGGGRGASMLPLMFKLCGYLGTRG